MAVAYIQEFAIVEGDLSTTNYDAISKALNLTTAPEGLIAHTAGFDQADGVFRIFDVWETREHGDRFFNEQLNPILERFMADAPEGAFQPPTLDTWYDLHDTLA